MFILFYCIPFKGQWTRINPSHSGLMKLWLAVSHQKTIIIFFYYCSFTASTDLPSCLNVISFCPPLPPLSGLYLRLCLFSGGVTEAAAGATTTSGRKRRRWGRCRGRLWPWRPLRPQPGSHGARSPTCAGGAAEAARPPDEGARGREGQAAAGGGPGHSTRWLRCYSYCEGGCYFSVHLDSTLDGSLVPATLFSAADMLHSSSPHSSWSTYPNTGTVLHSVQGCTWFRIGWRLKGDKKLCLLSSDDEATVVAQRRCSGSDASLWPIVFSRVFMTPNFLCNLDEGIA